MKKIVTITKVTKLIKVREITQDLRSEQSDEEVMLKYKLNWKQLEKVYEKLFYGRYLTEKDLIRRIEMRYGKDSSHIPLVRLVGPDAAYECEVCGFGSNYHFSRCPKCRSLNLRKLTKWMSSPGAEQPPLDMRAVFKTMELTHQADRAESEPVSAPASSHASGF